MSRLPIADTGRFVAMGQPSNSRYQAGQRFARRNDVTFVLPERVYEELTVDDPDVEAPPVDAAIDECWEGVVRTEATLVNDTSRTILADRSRVQQLLENLIRNAIKHGGANVTVTVGSLDDGFYCADDGPGIPPNEREQVFDAGNSTSEDGTGFGLSIVKQIVDAHGWEIHVSESAEGGARFEITGVESDTEK